jgi:hypothetical protein
VLEFVILLSLSDHEQYGFELISGIAKRAAIDVPEGTLYPLMLRLAKDGLISSASLMAMVAHPQILCPDSPGQGALRGMIRHGRSLPRLSIACCLEPPHDPCPILTRAVAGMPISLKLIACSRGLTQMWSNYAAI